MQQIAQFFKVSEEQFVRDWCAATRRSADEAKKVYQNIRLPRRATKGSAGYDFFAPESFTLVPHETILIPTGIRVMIEDGWVLSLYPRSGLGFRHRLQLDNTVGIIDSDYFEAKNEGHILIKMTSDDHKGKTLSVAAGDGFAQGIFLPFGITVDDEADGERTGGFGSTGLRLVAPFQHHGPGAVAEQDAGGALLPIDELAQALGGHHEHAAHVVAAHRAPGAGGFLAREGGAGHDEVGGGKPVDAAGAAQDMS